MNRCKIFDEDNRSRATHYKSMVMVREKKFGDQNCGKPYSAPPSHYSNPCNNQKIISNELASGGCDTFYPDIHINKKNI